MTHLLALFHALVYLTIPALSAFNFGPYPECAQSYLYNHAPTYCDYGNLNDQETAEEDKCLCADSGFLGGSAQDIWKNCGCSDLMTTANMIVDICVAYGSNSIYTTDEIIRIGDGGQATCLNPGATVSQTSQSVQSTQTTPQATSQDTSSTKSVDISTSSSVTSSASGTSSTSIQQTSQSDDATGLQKQSNQIALGCSLGVGLPGTLAAICALVHRCRVWMSSIC